MTAGRASRPTSIASVLLTTLGLSVLGMSWLVWTTVQLAGQGPSLSLLSRETPRAIPLTIVSDQEFVAPDELAGVFQLAVREESGAVTVSHKGRTIVLTPDQTIASVVGRVISLSALPMRFGGRLLVPIDFINRAIAPIYDSRVDLRRSSRLLIVGDMRVPRVTIGREAAGASLQLTIDASPQNHRHARGGPPREGDRNYS